MPGRTAAAELIAELDARQIATAVWATGYWPDQRWTGLPNTPTRQEPVRVIAAPTLANLSRTIPWPQLWPS
jgi:hypothetical protein